MLIGIDLGTTKSVVSYWYKNRPLIVEHNGKKSIPSEVHFLGGTQVKVGEVPFHEDNLFIGAIKRHLGRSSMVKITQNQSVHPQYIAAYILKELVQSACRDLREKGINEKIEGAVIAIPSHFDIHQRRATLEAAAIAGLKVKRLINEATASALAYASSQDAKSNIITVIDLGGGTLDISKMELEKDEVGNTLDVKYIDGITKLGGLDFDEAIFGWVKKWIDETNQHSNPIAKHIEWSIKREIANKKIEFSSQRIVHLFEPFRAIDANRVKQPSLHLTRKEFNNLARPLYGKVANHAKKAFTNFQEITEGKILLLGRARGLYGLKEYLEQELRTNLHSNVDPEVSVAKGAAIQCAIFENKTPKRLVIEALQDNYGIELADKKFEVFLTKGTTIPAEAEGEFETLTPDQDEIAIRVIKGTVQNPSENTLIQTVNLKNINNGLPGKTKIRIILRMNADMVLSLVVKNSGVRVHTENVVSTVGLSSEMIREYSDIVGALSSDCVDFSD